MSIRHVFEGSESIADAFWVAVRLREAVDSTNEYHPYR